MKRLLLDTHALIWFFEGSNELSTQAKAEISNTENAKFVSVVSLWEMAIKTSIGKLEMDLSMEDLRRLTWNNGIEVLPVEVEHTFLLRTLPFHHKDPFNRLIFSQATHEGLSLLSNGSIFDAYLSDEKGKRIW